jgi:hypothetical protein
MTSQGAPPPISEFALGPSVQTIMTAKMLQLLKKAAAFTAANTGQAGLTTEEHHALYNFCDLVDDALKLEQARLDATPESIAAQLESNNGRLTHLFCL